MVEEVKNGGGEVGRLFMFVCHAQGFSKEEKIQWEEMICGKTVKIVKSFVG